VQLQAYNLKRQQSSVKFYEIGRKYLVRDTLEQTEVLAGVVVGEKLPRQWGASTQPSDFYDVKGSFRATICYSQHDSGTLNLSRPRFKAYTRDAVQRFFIKSSA
jgi:phenylalanyl-tRNA synthetase beta subunit